MQQIDDNAEHAPLMLPNAPRRQRSDPAGIACMQNVFCEHNPDFPGHTDAAAGMDAIVHTASVFRKCDDMETQLVQPNIVLVENM